METEHSNFADRAPDMGRRRFLRWAGGFAAWMLLGWRHALAAMEFAKDPPPEFSLEDRLKPILQGRTPKRERITLDLPEIAEDGRVVPVRFVIDSPMTAENHIKRVHLLVDKNPDPSILSMDMSPALGTEWNLKIRMRESSTVRVIAEMGDSSLYSAEVAILVTHGGCD